MTKHDPKNKTPYPATSKLRTEYKRLKCGSFFPIRKHGKFILKNNYIEDSICTFLVQSLRNTLDKDKFNPFFKNAKRTKTMN